MIVLDASAAYLALNHDGETRHRVGGIGLAAPHHIDVELVSALRSRVREGAVAIEVARSAIATWYWAGITRFSVAGLLPRIWELRDNLTPYDAGYVALAEALGCDLVTADGRLARAPGPRCTISVVRT